MILDLLEHECVIFFIKFLSVTFNNSFASSSLEPASRESKGHLFWKWHWILAFEWTNYKRCVCCSKRGPLLIDSFCYVFISYVFIMVSWMNTSFKNSVLFQQKKKLDFSSLWQVKSKEVWKVQQLNFFFFSKKKKNCNLTSLLKVQTCDFHGTIIRLQTKFNCLDKTCLVMFLFSSQLGNLIIILWLLEFFLRHF